MDKTFFVDTLFDLINESDELEAVLQDIRAERDSLRVVMKDGSAFILSVRAD